MNKAYQVKTSQYCKVVGYIAPINNFNVGRKAEHDVRVKVAV